jgi:acyl-CoA thioester hydrolase
MNKKHEYKLRIRYVEIDGMKIVHNSNYPVFFEEARIDLVEKENYTYERIEQEGIIMPISESYIKFKNPVFYGEYITISVTVGYLKNFSLKFNYQIIKENGELACEGHTIHAFIERETKDFTLLPQELIKIFETYKE